MKFSEKKLEDILYEKLIHEDYENLYKKGFDYFDPEEERENSFVDRQVQLPPYGIADIVVTNTGRDYVKLEDREFTTYRAIIDIIELKVEPIKSKDFNQVLRYKKAVERYHELKFEADEEKYCFEVTVNCILIGNGIDHGHYIHESLLNEPYFYLYTYDFNPIDGIKFKHSIGGWYIEENESNIEAMDDSLLLVECANYFESEMEK